MTRRPAWMIVAAREIVVRLTNKTFIVSTLVSVGLLIGAFGLQGFLATKEQVMKVAVTEQAAHAIAVQVGGLARQEDSRSALEVVDVSSDDAAVATVRDDAADAYLKRTTDGWQLVARSEPSASLQRLTTQVVSANALAANAEAAGVDVATLTKGSTVTSHALDAGKSERDGIATVVSMVFAILFLLSSMMFGMQIAASIVEEKESRIVEIIASAIPVRQLLAGKILGNTAMAVGQIVLFVCVGLIGLTFTSYDTFLPTLVSSAGWYVVFFLAGFLALACLWALAGALSTRNEDLQSTTSPMTTILMISYLAGFMASGSWLTVLSYVPIVSTSLMPVRLFRGEAQWWEALASLALTLLFAVAAVLFSERLYRRSLLQTQGRLSLRQALALQD